MTGNLKCQKPRHFRQNCALVIRIAVVPQYWQCYPAGHGKLAWGPIQAWSEGGWMQGWLAREMMKRPLFYESGIVAKMLVKPWRKRSDAFFAILERMPAEGLAIDVGANRGQSALTIAAIKPGYQICSFEPNSSCALGLGAVQARLGARFTAQFEGLGDTDRISKYYEPCLYGFALTTEGTFNQANLGERARERMRLAFSLSQNEFGENYRVREKFFRVSHLDDFGLTPAFMKIDTQGFEVECVLGARETIDRASPVIVCEANRLQNEELHDLMGDLGYFPHIYMVEGNWLKPMDRTSAEDSGAGDIFFLRNTRVHEHLARAV
jgi:FkbM family methyltransferase